MNKKAIEAINKSIKIWKWLAETGVEFKSYAYFSLNLSTDEHYCPLCQYATDPGKVIDCSKCPVWGPSYKKYGYKGSCSGYENSPWYIWLNRKHESPEIAKQAALGMVDILERAKKGEWE